MASIVDICNRALQHLGAKTITSIDQDSNNARACKVAYEIVRDAELQAHPWSFAIKRVSLPALSSAPPFGFAAGFALPSDFLRWLPVDPLDNSVAVDWVVEGQTLLTNVGSAPLNLIYIAKITDTTQMTPLFIEALAARLAVELCETITQSNQKLTNVATIYDRKIKEARKVNAIQKMPVDPVVDDWLLARMRG